MTQQTLPGVSKYLCSGCGKYFNGRRSFDAHQRGLSCLSTDEMLIRRFSAKHMRVHKLREGQAYDEAHEVWCCFDKRYAEDEEDEES